MRLHMSLQTTLVAALAASTALADRVACGETRTLVTTLTGGQAGTSTTARGAGTFTIDTDADTLTFRLTFDSLLGAETAAHIHGPADIGDTAGPVVTLIPGNPKTGVWNYPASLEQDILDGRLYVNIHTDLFPSGEIRGQIVDMVAAMDDAQPTAGATCPTASGWGLFMIDVCADTLTYHVAVDGALCGTETSASINGVAIHGESGPMLEPLSLGSIKTGVWNYPAALEDAILDGGTYVTVATDVFPSGAVRGQITAFVAPVDGTQETPPVSTSSSGETHGSLDLDDGRLGFYIRYVDPLVETEAHIHGFAGPGEDAPPLFTLPASNPKVGSWDYDAVLESGILAGETYVNIHSLLNPDGEIRGQLVPPIGRVCPPPTCPWDLNDDGIVGINDLLILLAAWGPNPGHPADFDGDDVVGITDLLDLLPNWGPCP